MTENSQINKEGNGLIEFLIEDFKETGEHLRDTDRKLSLLIQVYTGAFVLVATLSVNNIIHQVDFAGLTGLVLILIFIFFTRWLFVYTLKSKETKQIYIHRMNFLRREMHYLLQNGNKDLPGYWTSSELTDTTKQLLATMPKNDKIRLKKVGLDDLYPNALRGILFLLSFVFSFVFSNIVYENDVLNITARFSFPFFMAVVFLVVALSIWLSTRKLAKDNEKSIEIQIDTYKLSSEKKDQQEKQELTTKRIEQKNIKANLQSNVRRKTKS